MAKIEIKDLEISNLDGNDLESFIVKIDNSSDLNLILGGSQVDFVVLRDGSIEEVILPCDPC